MDSSSFEERRQLVWSWPETPATPPPAFDLDYVVPRYQGFALGEFVYRSDGPLARLGYHQAVAPHGMKNAGDYLTDVGFRREGDDMVRDLV